jgi:hypothetical protein
MTAISGSGREEDEGMGHWHEINAPWYETRIINCSYCGRLIPKRIWLGGASEQDVFCGQKCELLWRDRTTQAANTSEDRQ